MSLSRGIMHQLYRAALFANAVYAAVASKPRKSSLDWFAVGIRDRFGVLRVTDGVEVLVEPREANEPPCHHSKALASLRGWQPVDQPAGVPMLKGCGPAQKCEARVREYLKEHPEANWKEIFRDVTNHYAHHRSMRGALPSIEYLKATND